MPRKKLTQRSSGSAKIADAVNPITGPSRPIVVRPVPAANGRRDACTKFPLIAGETPALQGLTL